MNKKMSPHIIAVVAFVVFIVLGLACASSNVITGDTGPIPPPGELVDGIIPAEAGTSFVAKMKWLDNNAESNTKYVIEVNSNENIGIHDIGGNALSRLQMGGIEGRGRYHITLVIKGVGGRWNIGMSDPRDDRLFIISRSHTIILEDITIQGTGTNANPRMVFQVNGSLIMNSGSTIIGNRFSAVDLMEGGTFEMNSGATITGSNGRGGVAVRGNFTMNGGTISNNTSGAGGGVCVFPRGVFTMNDGSITGNSAIGPPNIVNSGVGGGVNVMSMGIFNMNGGTISGNRASNSGDNIAGFGIINRTGGVIAQ
jgi:hypothetical protein